jgi:hypothetical protein
MFRTTIIGADTMQIDLFRMVNVYGMLVPMLGQSTNTVGRYFKEDYAFYDDFYRVMRS